MKQQNESDLVKRLEQLGIKVDVSPTGTTLTYKQNLALRKRIES